MALTDEDSRLDWLIPYPGPRGWKERTGLVSLLLSRLASRLHPWLTLGRGIRLLRATESLDGLASLLQPWLRGILLLFCAEAELTRTLCTPELTVESAVVVSTLPGDPERLPGCD